MKLDHNLLSLGFKRRQVKLAAYAHNERKTRLLVGIYVDDLVITGSDEEEIKKFRKQMLYLFSMNYLSLLSYYLGIKFAQSKAGITLPSCICKEKIGENQQG